MSAAPEGDRVASAGNASRSCASVSALPEQLSKCTAMTCGPAHRRDNDSSSNSGNSGADGSWVEPEPAGSGVVDGQCELSEVGARSSAR